MSYSHSINKEKALIWRIVHINNLSWILDNGFHSGNSHCKAPNWVSIGNRELIQRRNHISVPIYSGTVLNDYVPFYFTPFSPMMLNIHHGRGVSQQNNEDIIIFVSSLRHLKQNNFPFIFTDSHACYSWCNFFNDIDDLDKVDWSLLQSRDFKRDPNDPKKFERYQAEALIYQSCPVSMLLGIICYNDSIKEKIESELNIRGITHIQVLARPGWYFQ